MDNFSLNNGGIGHIFDQSLFDNIVDDLVEHGISVRENGVPGFVVKALCQGVEALPARQFKKAGEFQIIKTMQKNCRHMNTLSR